MRFAYADPPYPGTAHMYKDHPDYGGEVDHKALIERLSIDFPDGWALSTSSTALRDLLVCCPAKIHVMVWARSNASARPFIRDHVVYSWEAVILSGGRPLGMKNSVRDFHFSSINENGNQRHFLGQKPDSFLTWLFRCLGALPGDELVDLFPGSGAVSRAWDKYQRQIPLPTERAKEKQGALVEAVQ